MEAPVDTDPTPRFTPVEAAHFSEREIAEVTWLNAMENYYNLTNRPLNIGSDELCALVE